MLSLTNKSHYVTILIVLSIHCSTFVLCMDPLLEKLTPEYLQEFTDRLKHIVQKMTTKNTLEYGDKCDPAAEKIRNHFNQDVLGKLQSDPIGVLAGGGAFFEHIEEIVDADYNFCNPANLLECDSTTRTCDCFKNSQGLSLKFETRRQGDKCVALKGSMCSSADVSQTSATAAQQLGIQQLQAITCEMGTNCLIKGTQSPCNSMNLALEFGKDLVGGIKDAIISPESTGSASPLSDAVGNLVKKSTEFCACN